MRRLITLVLLAMVTVTVAGCIVEARPWRRRLVLVASLSLSLTRQVSARTRPATPSRGGAPDFHAGFSRLDWAVAQEYNHEL